jgi:hypothetical protein
MRNIKIVCCPACWANGPFTCSDSSVLVLLQSFLKNTRKPRRHFDPSFFMRTHGVDSSQSSRAQRLCAHCRLPPSLLNPKLRSQSPQVVGGLCAARRHRGDDVTTWCFLPRPVTY